MNNNLPIKTFHIDQCILCNSKSETIHKELQDLLFNVSGTWGINKCSNPECGLFWANPMPKKSDLHRLYKTYYTHASNDTKDTFLWRLYNNTVKAYLSIKYEYKTQVGFFYKALGCLLYLEPGIKALADAKIFQLPAKDMGKLLEVGCGSGKNLKYLSELGWDVEGIDFDEPAVLNAQKQGLNVSVSDLASKKYPDNHFDTIVSRHLIEHVPDPIALVDECYRVLKPNGLFVAYTPNTGSLGYSTYGKNWRGLEPPRHLYIFNISSLSNLVKNIGFSNIACQSTYAGAPILLASQELHQKGRVGQTNKILRIIKTIVLHYFEWATVKLNKQRGEEIVVTCRKPGPSTNK